MNENKSQQLASEITSFCKELVIKVNQKHLSTKPLIQTILTLTIAIVLGGNSGPNKGDWWVKD